MIYIRNGILFFFLAVALAACGNEPLQRVQFSYSGTEDIRRFAHTVILNSEYGGDGRAARFVGNITVSVIRGDASHRQLVASLVAQLNQALSGTGTQLILSSGANTNAQVQMHFAPMSNFPQIGSENGFNYVPGNSGFFWSWWGAGHVLKKSVVLVATNNASQIQSIALEELTQSLGLVGDQSFVQNSIFYETAGDSGYANRLSELDAALIRFFYSAITPGSGSTELDAALDAAGI